MELTGRPSTQEFAADGAGEFFARLGFHAEWVEDAPGLVLGRIVCQLVNEAWLRGRRGRRLGGGRRHRADAGLATRAGRSRGASAIGLEHVPAVLDGLWKERREERYRAAPLLRRVAALGRGLRDLA